MYTTEQKELIKKIFEIGKDDSIEPSVARKKIEVLNIELESISHNIDMYVWISGVGNLNDEEYVESYLSSLKFQVGLALSSDEVNMEKINEITMATSELKDKLARNQHLSDEDGAVFADIIAVLLNSYPRLRN